MAEARVLRADARRNRDRLLAAAAEVFAERASAATMEEIARRAEVGIGTLYRHFPTREAMMEGVFHHEVERLATAADELLIDRAPDAALAEWMQRFVRHVAVKRGLKEAIQSVVGERCEMFEESYRLIAEALGRLLRAASDAGAIRADVEPVDLLRALSGVCVVSDPVSLDGGQACRVAALLMDGLRFGSPTRVEPAIS